MQIDTEKARASYRKLPARNRTALGALQGEILKTAAMLIVWRKVGDRPAVMAHEYALHALVRAKRAMVMA